MNTSKQHWVWTQLTCALVLVRPFYLKSKPSYWKLTYVPPCPFRTYRHYISSSHIQQNILKYSLVLPGAVLPDGVYQPQVHIWKPMLVLQTTWTGRVIVVHLEEKKRLCEHEQQRGRETRLLEHEQWVETMRRNKWKKALGTWPVQQQWKKKVCNFP